MSERNKCLFTYEPLTKDETNYSAGGLKTLSRTIKALKPFPFTAEEQRKESQPLAGKCQFKASNQKLVST